MAGKTIAIAALVIIILAAVAAFLTLSSPPSTTTTATTTQTATPRPTQTSTPTTTTTTTATTPTSTTTPSGIQYDANMAAQGRKYFTDIGCVACHSVKSLGISGGSVGPDLSKVLLGNPGASGSVIGRWFSDNGLSDPKGNLGKAADLLKQFLINPPQYSTTMKTQVMAYKQTYNNWETEIVPALVEMLKEAAAKS